MARKRFPDKLKHPDKKYCDDCDLQLHKVEDGAKKGYCVTFAMSNLLDICCVTSDKPMCKFLKTNKIKLAEFERIQLEFNSEPHIGMPFDTWVKR